MKPPAGKLVHPELAGVQVDPGGGGLSRGDVILKAALAVGAASGLAMVGPFVRNAVAKTGSDVDTLNFLLAFEYLESAFYGAAYERVRGSHLDFFVGLIADYEMQHDEPLVSMIEGLDGKPVEKPKFDFSYSDDAGLLRLAQLIEETAVGAYSGAMLSIENKEALSLAGSIAQIEARFAGAVRAQNGEDPAPSAFDSPVSEAQVLATLEMFRR